MDLPIGPNIIQSTGTTTVASKAITLPQPVLAGNYIVVAGSIWKLTSTAGPVAISDDQGTTYTIYTTQDISWSSGISNGYIAYGKAPNSATYVITVTPAASCNITFGAVEVANVHLTAPLDVNGGESTATGTAASEDITTVVPNAAIFGLVHSASTGSNTSYTGASDMYDILTDQSNANGPWTLSWKRSASPGATTISWTLNTSREWRALSFSLVPDLTDEPVLGAGAFTLADVTIAGTGLVVAPPSGGPGLGQAITIGRLHRATLGF